MQETGEISAQYLNTNEIIADLLTKSLPKIKLKRCVDMLELRS